MSMFYNYPKRPASNECDNAFIILCNAHDASSSFLDIFETTRKGRKAKGTPTDEEQDLLRAMLAFASSGLDSMIKQLIKDSLRSVIDRNAGAAESFSTYIEKKIVKDDDLDHRLIARALCDVTPRGRLIDELLRDLTSGSLQAKDAIYRAGSFFDIPSKELSRNPDQLQKVFECRNEIIHEMDVDFAQKNRNRRPRRKQTMIDNTNVIFEVANNFLESVDSRAS